MHITYDLLSSKSIPYIKRENRVLVYFLNYKKVIIVLGPNVLLNDAHKKNRHTRNYQFTKYYFTRYFNLFFNFFYKLIIFIYYY